jgi:hypothetical protein
MSKFAATPDGPETMRGTLRARASGIDWLIAGARVVSMW